MHDALRSLVLDLSKVEASSVLINEFLTFLASGVVLSSENPSAGVNSAESDSSLLADLKVVS